MDRETFLNLRMAPPVVEAVETPQGTVYIRMMTAGEKDRFEAEHGRAPNKDFRTRVVIASICDEQGRLLFTAADTSHVSEISFLVIDPIVRASLRLNVLSQEAEEELRKKSESPDDDDSSDTREPLDSPRVISRPPSRALS